MNQRSINLLDLILIFLKNIRLYIITVVILTLLGLVLALIYPKKYSSELTFIANESSGLNLSSGGLLSGLANLSVSSSELTIDQVLLILRSDDLLDLVIDEFELAELYGNDISEALRIMLNNKISIIDYREGGLGFNTVVATKIVIEDDEPQRAFDMLNYFFAKADSIVLSKNKSNLKVSYDLLNKRYEQNLEDLSKAELEFQAFQLENGIVEIAEQSRLIVQNIAEIKAQLTSAELEYEINKKVLDPSSSNLMALELRLNTTKKLYEELLQSSDAGYVENEPIKKLGELPRLYTQYISLYRELEVQQEIFKVLYPQLEQQKLKYDEIQSGLMLIDDPDVPTYKSSPKRAYIVIAAFLFSNLLAILIIVYREWSRYIKENDETTYNKLGEIKSYLKF